MPRLARLVSGLLGAALLASCGGAQPPVPTAVPAITPVATEAPTAPVAVPTAPLATAEPTSSVPEVTPTTAPTAVVTLPAPTATPPLPAGLIDATSAARLTPLRAIGLGGLSSAAIMPDGTALVALTTAGLVWYTLPALVQARLDPVESGFQLTIAPRGDLLAYEISSTDGTPRSVIRRTADASLVAEVEGAAPSFSPDGTLVATGMGAYSDTQRAWVWNASDGSPVAEFEGVRTIFSPGSTYIATVALNAATAAITRIYPAQGGEALLEVAATMPAFSPDEKLVALSRGEHIEIYALPSGELQATILTTVEAAATFSPDGSVLRLLVGPDLWLWDVATEREIGRVAGVNRADAIYEPYVPTFGPAGSTLASLEPALGDCPPVGVTIRAVDDGRVLYEDDTSYSVAFGPRDDLFVGSTANGLLAVDLAAETASVVRLSGYESMALSPDGATLAVTSTGIDAEGQIVARVELWDLVTGEQRGELLTLPEDYVYSLAQLVFSPDGTQISALASYGCAAIGFRKLLTWDTAPGQIVSEIVDLPTQTDADGNLTDQLPAPFAIAPDGTAVAWVNEDGQVIVRRANGDEEVFNPDSPPTALAFTPEGSDVLAAIGEGSVRYLAPDGVDLIFGDVAGSVRELAFSPDGTRAVALLEDGGGALLDADSLAVASALNAPTGATGASFSADNSVVAVGEADGFALYDGMTGERLSEAQGSSTALIGPGRRLVATLEGGRVILWGAP